MEQQGLQIRTSSFNSHKDSPIRHPRQNKQKWQLVLLCLVQTSPEIFKNWSYDSGTIVCSQLTKLWVTANKVIGSKWMIHRKEYQKPKINKTTYFLKVTTINTQKTVGGIFLKGTSINVRLIEWWTKNHHLADNFFSFFFECIKFYSRNDYYWCIVAQQLSIGCFFYCPLLLL